MFNMCSFAEWHKEVHVGLYNLPFALFSMWSAAEGPKKDNINIGNNPQYRLEVKGLGAVWILLTRHITDKVSTYFISF